MRLVFVASRRRGKSRLAKWLSQEGAAAPESLDRRPTAAFVDEAEQLEAMSRKLKDYRPRGRSAFRESHSSVTYFDPSAHR